MEKGMGKGITEGKIETAKSLLREGVSLDVIVRATQLSLEQLIQLREEQS